MYRGKMKTITERSERKIVAWEAATLENTGKKRPSNILRSMLLGRIFFKEGYPNERN